MTHTTVRKNATCLAHIPFIVRPVICNHEQFPRACIQGLLFGSRPIGHGNCNCTSLRIWSIHSANFRVDSHLFFQKNIKGTSICSFLMCTCHCHTSGNLWRTYCIPTPAVVSTTNTIPSFVRKCKNLIPWIATDHLQHHCQLIFLTHHHTDSEHFF